MRVADCGSAMSPPPDIRVCFLGDSFILGTGDVDGLGWAGRVHAAERGRGIDLTSYNLLLDFGKPWMVRPARTQPAP